MLTIPIDVEEHEVEGILLCICIMFSASSVGGIIMILVDFLRCYMEYLEVLWRRRRGIAISHILPRVC